MNRRSFVGSLIAAITAIKTVPIISQSYQTCQPALIHSSIKDMSPILARDEYGLLCARVNGELVPVRSTSGPKKILKTANGLPYWCDPG